LTPGRLLGGRSRRLGNLLGDRARAVLAVPGARRLLVTSVAARFPLGMMALAILLLVRAGTGSFATAGVVVGAQTLTAAAVAPVQGALLDRRGGRALLLPLACADAAALAGLVLAARAHVSPAVLALLGGAAGGLIPPVDAYTRVLWPKVAGTPELLEAAYQLDATSQETIWTGGPLVVAGAIAWFSASAAVLLTALVGIVGTALFVATPLTRDPPVRERAVGRRSALASRGLRVVLVSGALMGLGVGAVEVALPALAAHSRSHGAAGLLLALWSVGSMLGGLLYGMRSWRLPPIPRYAVLLVFIGVATAPLILARSVLAGVPLSLIAGIGYAPALACQYLLIGRLAPREAIGEAFTWSTASLIFGIAGGAAISGSLVQHVGLASSFALGALSTAMGGAVVVAGRASMGAFADQPSSAPGEARECSESGLLDSPG
jgi:MFS family permease